MINAEKMPTARITETCAWITHMKNAAAKEERMLERDTILETVKTSRKVMSGRKNTHGV